MMIDRLILLFRTVKNHGIPQELITRTVEAGKKFFALPEEEKMKVLLLLVALIQA